VESKTRHVIKQENIHAYTLYKAQKNTVLRSTDMISNIAGTFLSIKTAKHVPVSLNKRLKEMNYALRHRSN